MALVYTLIGHIIVSALLYGLRAANKVAADKSDLLKQAFSLLTDDELSLLQQSVGDSCMDFTNQYDPEMWQDEYASNPYFAKLLDTQRATAEKDCEGIISPECQTDCKYYNHVLLWIGYIIEDNATEIAHLLKMSEYYSMSAGVFSWYDAGNPGISSICILYLIFYTQINI